MTLPLVSCIVPVFNGERTLAETLQSILRQTYSSLEIIVVDDGSQDETPAVLKMFSGKVHTVSRPHAGPSAARNFGVSLSRGEFIAFLDADDLWEEDKIRRQVEQLQQRPDLTASFCLVKNFWDPEVSGERDRLEKEGAIKFIHPFSLCSMLVRRQIFEEIGNFREDLVLGEDSEWLGRMEKAGIPYDVIPEKKVFRRLHANNLTRNMTLVTREELKERAREALLRSRQKEARDAAASVDAGSTEGSGDLFWKNLTGVFGRAEKKLNGSTRAYYRIAGHAVELRFAGQALVPLLPPALEHLRTGTVGDPELTVFLFDAASTEEPIPELPWKESDYTDQGTIRGYDRDEGIRAAHSRKSGILHLLHTGMRQAFFYTPQASAVAQPERGAPLVRIFSWWLRQKGVQVVHGGVVGNFREGVLLAGPGGSGKSTTALSCLAAGMSYLSDDYCLVTAGEPYAAHSLYCSAKMHTHALDRIPRLRTMAAGAEADPESGKTLLFLNRVSPGSLVPQLPLRAVLVPVISDQPESSLVRASSGVALRALAPSTLFQIPGSRSADFYELAKLTEKIPCYVLRLGTDSRDIPRVISEYLAS